MLKKRYAAFIAMLLAVAGFALTGALVDIDQDQPAPRAVLTVPLAQTATTPAGPTDVLRVPAAAVKQAAASDADDHGDSRDETPAGVPPAELEAGRQQQERFAAHDQLPVTAPDAAPQQAGCRSRFIPSYSSRRGVAPRLFVLHYTVSPNRLGWSDVDGITAYFARPATQASSHYVVDSEGHCNYIVREVDKAWTQAAGNPVSLSAEIINSGFEKQLLGPAGLAKIGRIISDSTKRWDIPLQVGAVSGCRVTRPGIITHQMFGACGGGHHDISPYQLGPVIAAAKTARAATTKPTATLTRVDRAQCRKLTWWRTNGRPHGAPERNAILRRQQMQRRGVTCTAKGPTRR